VLNDPEPAVYFTRFGDSALTMLLAFWVDNYSIRFATQDKINMEINTRFSKAGIEIPFPMRTVITRSEPSGDDKGKAKKTPSPKRKKP